MGIFGWGSDSPENIDGPYNERGSVQTHLDGLHVYSLTLKAIELFIGPKGIMLQEQYLGSCMTCTRTDGQKDGMHVYSLTLKAIELFIGPEGIMLQEQYLGSCMTCTRTDGQKDGMHVYPLTLKEPKGIMSQEQVSRIVYDVYSHRRTEGRNARVPFDSKGTERNHVTRTSI
ncbi:hypothetical protein J6590_065757 [Homalodisca vitripennis]|nr:hypothetical protein J6590_065757 [Homalodisca vitripennis]